MVARCDWLKVETFRAYQSAAESLLRLLLVFGVAVRLYFNQPVIAHQSFDDHHRRSRFYLAKIFAVSAANFFLIRSVGNIHAGSENIFESSAGIFDCCSDNFQTSFGLSVGIPGRSRRTIFRYRPGAGDSNNITDTDRALEADSFFVGGAGRYSFHSSQQSEPSQSLQQVGSQRLACLP